MACYERILSLYPVHSPEENNISQIFLKTTPLIHLVPTNHGYYMLTHYCAFNNLDLSSLLLLWHAMRIFYEEEEKECFLITMIFGEMVARMPV